MRKKNPLIFDLILFLGFVLASFGAYFLTEASGINGAIVSVSILILLSLGLVISR